MQCILLSPSNYFGSNCFIIKDGDEYAVIDPSVSFQDAAREIGDVSDKVRYILLTHAHFDHVWALDSWVKATGVTPTISEHDAGALSDPYANCSKTFLGLDFIYSAPYNTVIGGDRLPFGSTEIEVISTPGHTPGSVSYLYQSSVFVGDTVFSDGGYGRCDLPGGNSSLIKASINYLLTLPKDTVIYSGHGSKTTVYEASTYN